MSFHRMHSDLSNERHQAPQPVMRRIQSDITDALPAAGPHPALPAPEQQQHHAPPPLASLEHSVKHEDSGLSHRKGSVYELLGGGKFADIVLWRQRRTSALILASSTLVWFLFEWSGYTLVSLLARALLTTLLVLFAWSNMAALVNRPLPPLPELQVSDEKMNKMAKRFAREVNAILNGVHHLGSGKDFPVLLKCSVFLWILAQVGQWFSLLTLIYLATIATLTLPLAYEQHDKQIDEFFKKVADKVKAEYHKFDEKCLSKIPCCN